MRSIHFSTPMAELELFKIKSSQSYSLIITQTALITMVKVNVSYLPAMIT